MLPTPVWWSLLDGSSRWFLWKGQRPTKQLSSVSQSEGSVWKNNQIRRIRAAGGGMWVEGMLNGGWKQGMEQRHPRDFSMTLTSCSGVGRRQRQVPVLHLLLADFHSSFPFILSLIPSIPLCFLSYHVILLALFKFSQIFLVLNRQCEPQSL